MFTVYVLYSSKHKRTYTGYSSDFPARLKSHNELGTKDWATKCRPGEVLLTEEYKDKKQAMAREKFLQSGQGREFIKKQVEQKYEVKKKTNS